MTVVRDKAQDEIFCFSCGELVKKQAVYCPNCGVENTRAESQADSSTETVTPQAVTTVSDTWRFGILGGLILWIPAFLLSGSDVSWINTTFTLVGVVAWLMIPVSAYYDMKYVRVNSDWNPRTLVWMVGLIIFLAQILVALIYLYRRYEVLGKA